MREYLSDSADSRRWNDFTFRSGDVVISTPAKCGTTWTQMLVALLVFDSPDLPAPLTVLSPWLDNELTPWATLEDRLARQEHRRFIKTHVPLDGLPLDERVYYVVVGRDPRDAFLSLADHGKAMDDDHMDAVLTQSIGEDELARRPAVTPEAETFAEAIEMDRGNCHTRVHLSHILHHLNDAWERQDEPNVALTHYADLSADPAGSLARLAGELDFDVSPMRCKELAGYADIGEMRGRATDLAPEVDHGAWHDPARFFAAGRVGAWRSAFDEEDLTRYEIRAAELYPDEEFLSWAHNGSTGGDWRH
jgi:aryl sulfotransferase